MSVHLIRTALVLGFISAIGPFAIDMYLPALPAIAKDLHANEAAVQMSLILFSGYSADADVLRAVLRYLWP